VQFAAAESRIKLRGEEAARPRKEREGDAGGAQGEAQESQVSGEFIELCEKERGEEREREREREGARN